MDWTKTTFGLWVVLLFATIATSAQQVLTCTVNPSGPDRSSAHFHQAGSSEFQYVGRIEISQPDQPRFWSSGSYVTANFSGSTCILYFKDQVLNGTVHNYLEIIIDQNPPIRIQTAGPVNAFKVHGLQKGTHTLLICKDTETGNGYLEFEGLTCDHLLLPSPLPSLKMEFIGNSITCGFGADPSAIPCKTAQWYDQHNAYMSYGPLTARALNAQWQISAVSGIGMIHSCCGLPLLMPQAFDKTDMRDDSIVWNFSRYIPDLVTICLGQNDGIQDSTTFCRAYVDFVKSVRVRYPTASIILLTSPMAGKELKSVLTGYLGSITKWFHGAGDLNIHLCVLPGGLNGGCDGHPDLDQQQLISRELVHFIREKGILQR